MAFKKVRPRKVSAIAAEQIVDAIQREDSPGDADYRISPWKRQLHPA